jgi:hypothetical protein
MGKRVLNPIHTNAHNKKVIVWSWMTRKLIKCTKDVEFFSHICMHGTLNLWLKV